MFKYTAAAGIALASAFAVSGASAHDSYGHSHYSASTTTPVYSNTYTAPTIDLGPIEYVQPSSTVQYVQPATSYIQPATTTTYSAPVSTYTTPSYTTPSYAAQTSYSYAAPNYGTTYTAPSSTYATTYSTPTYYTTPAYAPASYTTPSYSTGYSTPSYVSTYQQTVPRYTALDRVRARMARLQSSIRDAESRGQLRDGEKVKLRGNMMKIRGKIREYQSNDGVIDQAELAKLRKTMARQSDRIARLANNDQTAGQLVSPYGNQFLRF